MKLLVFGQNGQLARALARLCSAHNIEAQFIGSNTVDLAANPQQAYDIIKTSNADIIINAAAYTQVDRAETETQLANQLNAASPQAMARACKDSGKAFIHVSTDYVFQGQNSCPYKTDDPIAPLNAYGQTKADGEIAISAIAGRNSIIRTSWVYDGMGANFLNTMLRLAKSRDEITVVHDQIGRPTYAGDLAQACFNLAQKFHAGVSVNDMYHVTNSGEPISWADFARAIFDVAGIDCSVKDIPTTDYPTPAKRPAYSVLDLSDYEDAFGPLPTWQDGLKRALAERKI